MITENGQNPMLFFFLLSTLYFHVLTNWVQQIMYQFSVTDGKKAMLHWQQSKYGIINMWRLTALGARPNRP